MFLILGIVYNADTPSGFGTGWSIPSGRGHYCGLILSSSGGDAISKIFTRCPPRHLSYQGCRFSHLQSLAEARRAYIIIANIKIGIYKLRRSDIIPPPSGFIFLILGIVYIPYSFLWFFLVSRFFFV